MAPPDQSNEAPLWVRDLVSSHRNFVRSIEQSHDDLCRRIQAMEAHQEKMSEALVQIVRVEERTDRTADILEKMNAESRDSILRIHTRLDEALRTQTELYGRIERQLADRAPSVALDAAEARITRVEHRLSTFAGIAVGLSLAAGVLAVLTGWITKTQLEPLIEAAEKINQEHYTNESQEKVINELKEAIHGKP